MSFQLLKHRRPSRLSALCLALGFAFTTACLSEEEEDCEVTGTCESSNNNDSNNNDSNNNDNSQSGDESGDNQGNSQCNADLPWPCVDTSDPAAIYDFLPYGVFGFKKPNDDTVELIAKNLDGSIITADIKWDEEHDNHNTIQTWKLWVDDMYYWVNHEIVGEDAGQRDQFWTLSLKHPDSTPQNPVSFSLDTAWGADAGGAVFPGHNPYFIRDDYTDFVYRVHQSMAGATGIEFEKDDEVSGIPCKKYIYRDYTGKISDEWWILDNGFLLKHNSWSTWKDEPEIVNSDSLELIFYEFDTATHDDVLQKYGRFRNQIGDTIPPVADMFKVTEAVAGGEWIAPESLYLPWTAGGIDFMIVMHNSNADPETSKPHSVRVYFKEGIDLREELDAYMEEIMKIEGMVLDSNDLGYDGCAEPIVAGDGTTADFGCHWEYDNYGSQDCGWFQYYKIWTEGTGINNSSVPTTPSTMYLQSVDIICV